MASLWTLFTKGYAEYEIEKRMEPAQKMFLDTIFRTGFSSCSDEDILQGYECAGNVGDSEKKKLLYEEMKRRGLD